MKAASCGVAALLICSVSAGVKIGQQYLFHSGSANVVEIKCNFCCYVQIKPTCGQPQLYFNTINILLFDTRL